MTSRAARWPAALVLITLAALSLRLVGLDRRSLTHPEAYVPRIQYPAAAISPPTQDTFADVMSMVEKYDVNPPGYYVAMWLWTGRVGTGLKAIRLPSAVAGSALVLVVWALLVRTDTRQVTLFAAVLTALHGHHLFWSQQARMWAF